MPGIQGRANLRGTDLDGLIMRRVLATAGVAAAVLAILASQASATTKNVNFVGTWSTSNGQPFTIVKENRKTGACSGTTSLSKQDDHKLVACHVTGDRYAFTITYGTGYKSYNKGTITGSKLKGSFHDTNGSTAPYTAVRTKR